jgi:hypothetical protein
MSKTIRAGGFLGGMKGPAKNLSKSCLRTCDDAKRGHGGHGQKETRVCPGGD